MSIGASRLSYVGRLRRPRSDPGSPSEIDLVTPTGARRPLVARIVTVTLPFADNFRPLATKRPTPKGSAYFVW